MIVVEEGIDCEGSLGFICAKLGGLVPDQCQRIGKSGVLTEYLLAVRCSARRPSRWKLEVAAEKFHSSMPIRPWLCALYPPFSSSIQFYSTTALHGCQSLFGALVPQCADCLRPDG